MTEKQKRFVEEYLIDLNATQAAIRAGYSPKTAQEQGSQNLSKLMVPIAKAKAERSRRTGISQDRVIQELARIAFVNAADVIDVEDASVVADASRDDLACIQAVKFKQMSGDKGDMTEREVKLADKLKALELLGKHLGLFDTQADTGGAAITDFLKAMRPTQTDLEALYGDEEE
ncbi:MAG: terminase small subunit [Eubacteriales bacterium]|nr:terminase small subunit [Eubacteriales bacterium]